jgi:hypothetical protein
MHFTGPASAHQQNVTARKNHHANGKATYISTPQQQQQQRGKHEAQLSSESDISTVLRNNRCRRKAAFAAYSTCMALLLVLTCLVNVIGALHSSSSSPLSSVNYYDNSTNNFTRSLLDDIDAAPSLSALFDDSNDIENLTVVASGRRQPIYQNEFAVHIFGGAEKADRVARKYGFTNMGQVSRLHAHFSSPSPWSECLARAHTYSRHVSSVAAAFMYRKTE